MVLIAGPTTYQAHIDSSNPKAIDSVASATTAGQMVSEQTNAGPQQSVTPVKASSTDTKTLEGVSNTVAATQHQQTAPVAAIPVPRVSREESTTTAPWNSPLNILPSKSEFTDISETLVHGDRAFIAKTPKFFQSKVEDQQRYSEYALVLHRLYNTERRELSRKLKINSQKLRRAFVAIVKISDSADLNANPIILEPPYKDLFHHREAFFKACSDSTFDDTTREELKLIRDFIERALSPVIREFNRLLEARIINMKLLWGLFPPGKLCITYSDFDTEECCVVESAEYGERGALVVRSLHTAFDGSSWGVERRTTAISFNTEVIDVLSLNIFPLEYKKEQEQAKLVQTLTERGRSYAQLLRCRGAMMQQHYSGRIVPMSDDNGDVRNLFVDGRVMLDREVAWEKNRDTRVELAWKPDADAKDRLDRKTVSLVRQRLQAMHHIFEDDLEEGEGLLPLDPDSLEEDGHLSKSHKNGKSSVPLETYGIRSRAETHVDELHAHEDFLCCPAIVEGYSLQQKLWGYFAVDKFAPIDWHEHAFDNLQLDTDIKELVMHLVKPLKEEADQLDDDIAGKGKGLVFLLHGSPGLGKTLTAESVAEHSHRPLYALTSGELSSDLDNLESNIRSAFYLAKRWEAILLIDEADIFMARRSSSNVLQLARNAIVTVFLKQVEYFQGLLFLTTNRVEDFDPAFDSRIHLTIQYPDLRPQQRTQIWKDRLANASIDDSFTEDVYRRLGQRDLNGREIKNTIRTAYVFALSQKRSINSKDIFTILKVAKTTTRKEIKESPLEPAEMEDLEFATQFEICNP